MNPALAAALLGGVLGTGLVLGLRALLPPAPIDLAAAWQQVTTRATGTPTRRYPHERVLADLAARTEKARHPWIAPPVSDLDLLDLTTTDYMRQRLVWAFGALGAATVFAVSLHALGLAAPLLVALVLAAGAAGALVPMLRFRDHAASARGECRQVLACYLDLVAQQRTAGAAPAPALAGAARIGQHWLFTHLARVIAHAHRIGHTPWHALRELGHRWQVPELVEVAEIADTAADGAAIYTSLTAQAATLRATTRTGERAEANARSERLTLPVSLLMVAFLALVLYPTVTTLLG